MEAAEKNVEKKGTPKMNEIDRVLSQAILVIIALFGLMFIFLKFGL